MFKGDESDSLSSPSVFLAFCECELRHVRRSLDQFHIVERALRLRFGRLPPGIITPQLQLHPEQHTGQDDGTERDE